MLEYIGNIGHIDQVNYVLYGLYRSYRLSIHILQYIYICTSHTICIYVYTAYVHITYICFVSILSCMYIFLHLYLSSK